MRSIAFSALLCQIVVADPSDEWGDDDSGLSLLQFSHHKQTQSQCPPGTAQMQGCRGPLQGCHRTCEFEGDTHVVEDPHSAAYRPGLSQFLNLKDGSITSEVYQCPWPGNAAAITALLLKLGSNVLEFQKSDQQHCNSPSIKLNGEIFDVENAPYEGSDGLYIEMTGASRICIDAPGGESSFFIKYDGICEDTQWAHFDGKATVPVTLLEFDDGDTICGSNFVGHDDIRTMEQKGKIVGAVTQSMFPPESHDRFCDDPKYCQWNDPSYSCEKPPPPPPPPAESEAICTQNSCPYDTAKTRCRSLENHPALYEDCLYDVCATCEQAEAIANADIEFNEEANPGPVCVDAANCGLPNEACASLTKMNVHTASQSNLGGVGPDSGDEVLKYDNAAAVDGKILDLVVKQVGGDYAAKGDKNGRSGQFGVINMQSGSNIDLEFSFVDHLTGNPVSLEGVGITFYDLDEGKKEKSRSSLTACGASNAILTTSTELTVERPDNCYKISSSQHGNAKNNPKDALSLSPDQAGRSVTFTYADVDKITVKYEMSSGYGYRNLNFAMEPALACMSGFDPEIQLPA